MKPSQALPIGLLALAAAAAGAYLASRPPAAPGPALQGGVLLPQPRLLAPFALTDQDGKPFTNAQLRGRWSLLFAGFTHCPDVCPATLATFKQLAQQLGAQAPALLFLSVDPERDTPAVVKSYVNYFGPAIRGLVASPDALTPLCENLGVAFLKVPGKAPGDYTVDHSAALVLIDPQGRVAGYFPPPHKVDTLAADLARLGGTPG